MHTGILTTAFVKKLDGYVWFYVVTYSRRRILWLRDRPGQLCFSFVWRCSSKKWANMPSSILNDWLTFIERWIHRAFSLLYQTMTSEFPNISVYFQRREREARIQKQLRNSRLLEYSYNQSMSTSFLASRWQSRIWAYMLYLEQIWTSLFEHKSQFLYPISVYRPASVICDHLKSFLSGFNSSYNTLPFIFYVDLRIPRCS
jgi:hypothetical protein